jgi:hypothetical protein
MVHIEVRSMTKRNFVDGLDLIFRKILTFGLKEGIKALCFLRVRYHGSSMAQSYDYLKMLTLI